MLTLQLLDAMTQLVELLLYGLVPNMRLSAQAQCGHCALLDVLQPTLDPLERVAMLVMHSSVIGQGCLNLLK
jgi:hypothetical protein